MDPRAIAHGIGLLCAVFGCKSLIDAVVAKDSSVCKWQLVVSPRTPLFTNIDEKPKEFPFVSFVEHSTGPKRDYNMDLKRARIATEVGVARQEKELYASLTTRISKSALEGVSYSIKSSGEIQETTTRKEANSLLPPCITEEDASTGSGRSRLPCLATTDKGTVAKKDNYMLNKQEKKKS